MPFLIEKVTLRKPEYLPTWLFRRKKAIHEGGFYRLVSKLARSYEGNPATKRVVFE